MNKRYLGGKWFFGVVFLAVVAMATLVEAGTWGYPVA